MTSLIGTSIASGAPPAASQPTASTISIQFDFSVARSVTFISDAILDEDTRVVAEGERDFLTLPFLYQITGGDVSLSRLSLKGKETKSFYGFRALAPKDGRPSPNEMESQTVYERLDIKQPLATDSGPELAKPTLMARNLSAPRKIGTDKSKTPFKPSVDALPRTGCAALILEVPRAAKTVAVDFAGAEETIDLEFLRRARDSIALPTGQDGQPDLTDTPAAVADIIEHVGGGTPAITALAIEQLASNHRNWPKIDSARWVVGVDTSVLSAAGRDSPLVQNAVWRYFSSGGMAGSPSANLSTSILDYLAASDDALQMQVIRMVRCGLGLDDCGVVWSRPAPREYMPESSMASALALLGGVLRVDDEHVCEAAADVVMRLNPSTIDWSFLGAASATAQRLLLERLEKSHEPRSADRLLHALLRAPQPETASALAKLAEKSHLRLGREDASLVAGWQALKSTDERTALFTALAGTNTIDLLYSDSFANCLHDAMVESTADAEQEQAMREAAWEFALRQARKIHPAVSTSQPSAGRSKPRAGPFPLLIARTARDPLVSALGDAARRGPRAIRSQALVALLQQGYAEEVARALMDNGTTSQQREVLLKELAAKDASIVGRDALCALLGHLLRHECSANAPWILARLSAIKAKMSGDESWRLCAAIKAGVNFSELDLLASSLKPPASDSALGWLRELAHMTPQDQQALAAMAKPDERAAILNRIDLRRARLVDGQYGVLLVVETQLIAAVETSELTIDTPRPSTNARLWCPPQRITLAAPPLMINSNDEREANGEQKLRVSSNGRQLGEGLLIIKAKSVGGPARFSPVLQVAAWNDLSEGRLAGPSTSDAAVGPVVLQHRAVVEPLTPGTMNLDIAEYLRATLSTQKLLVTADIDAMLPKSCPITLRYASFGSYYGCTPDLPPPESAGPTPSRKLLAVMMILEKME